MITLIGSHRVNDMDAFDELAHSARESGEMAAVYEKMGVTGTDSYREVDGDRVVVVHTFNDLKSAQNFKEMIESAEMQARMEGAGAILPATFWIVEER